MAARTSAVISSLAAKAALCDGPDFHPWYPAAREAASSGGSAGVSTPEILAKQGNLSSHTALRATAEAASRSAAGARLRATFPASLASSFAFATCFAALTPMSCAACALALDPPARLCRKQDRCRRPVRPKRLIGVGWPKLGAA